MISRRRALKYMATLAGMAGIVTQRSIGEAAEVAEEHIKTNSPKRVLRVAHITDVHLYERYDGAAWFAKCLKHIHNQEIRPDLIMNTGDSIDDALKKDKAAARAQWDLWNKTLEANCTIPIKHCIGNHDIWGWSLDADSPAREDSEFGIKYALKHLNLEREYYSFDKGGWHFIVLNGNQPMDKPGYTAFLDKPQMEWLKEDLKKTDPKTPIIIFSHIPIISVACMALSKPDENNNLIVLHRYMHTDFNEIVELFSHYPNIKSCHSGHIHILDEIQFYNVKYCCNGAVSGAWWRGARNNIEPGYSLIDLYDDGTFQRQYVTYGWEPTSPELKK